MRSRRPIIATCLFIVAQAWAAAAPSVALARREATFAYPFSRVWPSAVRLLRVDFECPITEKDKDEGYFFFDYTDHGKAFPGSVELTPTKQNGVESVRVVVQIPAMPSYVEAMVLDRLSRKLLTEFGTPKDAAPAPAAPAPDPSDAPKSDAPAKNTGESDEDHSRPREKTDAARKGDDTAKARPAD